MSDFYEIGETIATTSEYTEILTLIHNVLVEVNQDIDVLLNTIMFTGGIISGVIVGAACSFFIGQLLKTR